MPVWKLGVGVGLPARGTCPPTPARGGRGHPSNPPTRVQVRGQTGRVYIQFILLMVSGWLNPPLQNPVEEIGSLLFSLFSLLSSQRDWVAQPAPTKSSRGQDTVPYGRGSCCSPSHPVLSLSKEELRISVPVTVSLSKEACRRELAEGSERRSATLKFTADRLLGSSYGLTVILTLDIPQTGFGTLKAIKLGFKKGAVGL